MCGVAGALLLESTTGERDVDGAVRRMCDRMKVRGPDAEGYWSDSNIPLALGHRRLSIIDLSSHANQPMVSDDGRYVIVFNGEIYNFRALRRDLEEDGTVFRTKSDTEVLLALFARNGEAMLPNLRGMFAFAIWDNYAQSLFLARDPYGIKPLYYSRTKEGWLFASQVKALLASDMVAKEADAFGQMSFWLLGSVSEPHTWYRDVKALQAGSWCRITADGRFDGPNNYWDIGDSWRGAPESQPPGDEIKHIVAPALVDSVEAHLVSDVPVGVFLSGGIDSGALAGVMKQVGATDLKGVTIAFSEFEGRPSDEAPVAAKIARQYGIDHHVRTVTKEEFETDLPRILDAMDQPSIDGVNTWYASKAVSELGLKVVVSGVGGDELFQGYDSFRELPALVRRWCRVRAIPGAESVARLVLGWQARRTGNLRWRLLPTLANSIEGAWFLSRGLFAPEELPAVMDNDLLAALAADFDGAECVRDMTGQLAMSAPLAVGQIESMTYLRNQLLRDSDWASMDHSVELRTPLVDAHLLAALQSALPSFDQYSNKRLLAEAPDRPLRREIIERPKTGFGIPIGRWLAETSQVNADELGSRAWAKRVASSYDEQL
jgi:asparagine synthase (glutamine-hydrolysing)